MKYSNLVSYTKISPHKYKRTAPVSKITVHHMAGDLTVETCGEVFQTTRQASSNYGIGSDGRIACYVPEDYRALTSNNYDNDNRAITIEVANCSGGPDWKVSDKAFAALIDLCVDICTRYNFQLNYTGNKSGNLTMHQWFAPTLCPGPYLKARFPEIANKVNARLGAEPAPTPVTPTVYRPTVREWQLAAIADGFEFPRYGADGAWGSECEAVARAAVVKKRSTYMYQNLTRLVQKVVGADPDGLCGNATAAAIAQYQSEHNLTPDGAAGVNTYKTMLGLI